MIESLPSLPTDRHAVSRREGLALIGCGLGAVLARAAHGAEVSRRGAVDVHSHFFPPSLRRASDKTLAALTGGQVPPGVRDWTPAHTLEAMDRSGIALSVVSASWRPSLAEIGQDKLREIARSANEYAAEMARDHSGRLSHFAFLPMPDIEGSLAEIAYCLDVLKAPGVAGRPRFHTSARGAQSPKGRSVLSSSTSCVLFEPDAKHHGSRSWTA
jgi:hypothetical protein